jgi:hypothetical protein
MSSDQGTRHIIPGGRVQFAWRNLVPIVQLLMERGHPLIYDNGNSGFVSTPGRWICSLGRAITADDWEAINERFALPDTIVFVNSVIRDGINKIDIIGFDEIKAPNGVVSIDEWEEQERREGLGFARP